MWIQFMFHLSAVCDKVQSFVATVTLKQCVYILEQQIVEENLLSLVWILLPTYVEQLFSIHSNSLFWNHRFAYCTFYLESRWMPMQEIQKCLQRSYKFFFKGGIFVFFLVHYSTLFHLPPLRFHCVGGCWDRIEPRKFEKLDILYFQTEACLGAWKVLFKVLKFSEEWDLFDMKIRILSTYKIC
jgi:hypothetical protein